jgi:hypothetical protein
MQLQSHSLIPAVSFEGIACRDRRQGVGGAKSLHIDSLDGLDFIDNPFGRLILRQL